MHLKKYLRGFSIEKQVKQMSTRKEIGSNISQVNLKSSVILTLFLWSSKVDWEFFIFKLTSLQHPRKGGVISIQH